MKIEQDGEEWTIDEPLLSPKRLYNATRLFLFFMYLEPERYYPLWFYYRWYRRKEARWRKLGY